MHQLATEGGGFGPRGFGVPGAADNNAKSYVYDIDNRNNQCIAVTKVMDISTTLCSDVDVCPVGTGAKVGSVSGGVVAGYDMYGQYQKETVGAAGTSVACYSAIATAPADALWVNEFGLPYTYASDTATGDVSYVAPTGINKRGSFVFSGDFPDEATHDYIVDRVNMFGDNSADFAGGQPGEAAVIVAATVDNTGVIAITQTALGDGSASITYRFPDSGQITQADGAATVNYTLSPLWMSKYARNQILEEVLDGLIRAASDIGTHVIVDLTGGITPTPKAKQGEQPSVQGPFSAFGTEFWVNTDTCKIGFDADSDSVADVWFTIGQIDANADITDQSKLAYRAQLEALGCA